MRLFFICFCILNLLVFQSFQVLAQVPKSFAYQGIAFDSNGAGVASKQISIKFDILQGNSTGTSVYQEIHRVLTDKFGHFIVNVGQGLVTSGSFSGIAWATNSIYLKVDLDLNGNSNFTTAGVSQLLAVPYALHAQSSTQTVGLVSDGSGNTKGGTGVMDVLSGGANNTAFGLNALNRVSNGYSNTAIGTDALKNLTSGPNNIAIGSSALEKTTDGSRNVAVGVGAMASNTTGYVNNAFGFLAMLKNTNGFENNVFGHQAMEQNLSGNGNSVFGHNALQDGLTGNFNTAVGYTALKTNVSDNNSAFGAGAGAGNVSGSFNTYVGYGSTPVSGSLSNATVIGANGKVSSSNTISFGDGQVNKWVFGIPTTTNGSYALQVGSNTTNGNGAFLTSGGTWTNASGRNFKTDFQPLDGAQVLDRIKAMDIQKWKYKNTDEWHVGPIAEEFKAAFDLGLVDDSTHISTIDASGVSLRAIQELIKENEILRGKMEEIQQFILQLEPRKMRKKNRNGCSLNQTQK